MAWVWLGMICRDELSLELRLIIPNNRHYKLNFSDTIIAEEVQSSKMKLLVRSRWCNTKHRMSGPPVIEQGKLENQGSLVYHSRISRVGFIKARIVT